MVEKLLECDSYQLSSAPSQFTVIGNTQRGTLSFDAMEKIKVFGKKVGEAGKTGKSKIDEIRTKEWAEPTGAVLKAAANAAGLIPPPVGGVIKGALSIGGIEQGSGAGRSREQICLLI